MKSIVYPYVYHFENRLWIMRDGVGEKPRRTTRKSEVVAWDLQPSEVIDGIKDQNLGRHFISHFQTLDVDPIGIKEAYKSHGYRNLLSEGFFVHDSSRLPDFSTPPIVKRVCTLEESKLISRERRNRKAIRDVDLDAESPDHRLYAIFEGKKALGWVGSVPIGKASWIADLYVLPEYRGRGFGSALMSEVTREDRRNGVKTSVLLASAAGARLYPHLGYRQIGTLQLFCPKH